MSNPNELDKLPSVALRILLQREMSRNAELETDNKHLNQLIRDKIIPALLAATTAIQASQRLAQDIQNQRDWDVRPIDAAIDASIASLDERITTLERKLQALEEADVALDGELANFMTQQYQHDERITMLEAANNQSNQKTEPNQ